ncbi:MAG: hypothetical protein H6747_11300 [Deltaproteobacteria bacterium]|nr:hypothetical protein [Deltaproteobacteria bacterium]
MNLVLVNKARDCVAMVSVDGESKTVSPGQEMRVAVSAGVVHQVTHWDEVRARNRTDSVTSAHGTTHFPVTCEERTRFSIEVFGGVGFGTSGGTNGVVAALSATAAYLPTRRKAYRYSGPALLVNASSVDGTSFNTILGFGYSIWGRAGTSALGVGVVAGTLSPMVLSRGGWMFSRNLGIVLEAQYSFLGSGFAGVSLGLNYRI